MSHVQPTIFIVDDDPSARRGISRLLTAAGMPVEVYGSARDFLHQADREMPGCLLLDMKMPGMTGIELQDVLFKEKNELSIIFISGQMEIFRTADVIKKGAVKVLAKPIDQALLFPAIEQALKRHR